MNIPRLALPRLNTVVGVDLGSTHIRVGCNTHEGVEIFSEANCLAIEESSKKILEFGDEALVMQRRVKESIAVLHPIRSGVVYDDEQVQILVKLILEKYKLFSFLGLTRYMVTVPTDATMVEKQLAVETIQSLGAREVFTISQSLAASIGSGVPIADATGSFMFHLGYSHAEAVAISLGSVVAFQSSPRAGRAVIKAIQRWFEQEEHLYISREVAQTILESGMCKEVTVLGQDLHKKNPREIEFVPQRIDSLLLQFMKEWSTQVRQLLATVPPQLTADILDKGLLLSGGLAQIPGLVEHFVHSLGVPVSVVDDPEESAIRGVCVALKHIDAFKKSLGYLDTN